VHIFEETSISLIPTIFVGSIGERISLLFVKESLMRAIKQESYARKVAKIGMWLIGYARANMAIYKLRSSAASFVKLDDIVNFAFSFRFLGISIKPTQVKEEIMGLLKLLQNIKPKVVLEIGTARGGTLFLFTRVVQPDTTLISIDLLGGPFGGGYPTWRIPLYESFALPCQKIQLIRRDSHDPVTLGAIKNILDGRKVDFLFIDGDHSYEGVKRDFEMYSGLVGKGGIIAFHDICHHPPETGCEVNRFWVEVNKKYRYLELVKDWEQGWAGIGVIHVSHREPRNYCARAHL